jgi:hypothetical protein
MPYKFAQLEDARMVRLYLVLSELVDGDLADERLMVEAADIMAELSEEAYAEGEAAGQSEGSDELPFDLLDALADESHPGARRMRELMRERGWTGWTRQEKLG